jgi:cytochrome c oxidase subunit 4
MHLRYDRLFNAIILIVALLFVMLFIGLALHDTQAYQHELRAYTQSQAP